ncbi:MAG: hypothetical protein ACOZAN_03610 [Patescibacteria group bacterium]
MSALPKNKITSVERGKRRKGNLPSIKKDAKISVVPNHKKGLVSTILKAVGLEIKAEKK